MKNALTEMLKDTVINFKESKWQNSYKKIQENIPNGPPLWFKRAFSMLFLVCCF